MQPSALAAAAAQARSMETSLPLAPPDEAIHGTVVHRSRNALHLVEHPIEQLHNCCNKTTLPGDTDMNDEDWYTRLGAADDDGATGLARHDCNE